MQQLDLTRSVVLGHEWEEFLLAQTVRLAPAGGSVDGVVVVVAQRRAVEVAT